jgi:hypothetical protein
MVTGDSSCESRVGGKVFFFLLYRGFLCVGGLGVKATVCSDSPAVKANWIYHLGCSITPSNPNSPRIMLGSMNLPSVFDFRPKQP